LLIGFLVFLQFNSGVITVKSYCLAAYGISVWLQTSKIINIHGFGTTPLIINLFVYSPSRYFVDSRPGRDFLMGIFPGRTGGRLNGGLDGDSGLEVELEFEGM